VRTAPPWPGVSGTHEIASRIQEVRVVVGADGLKTLLPAGLLGESKTYGNGKATGETK
jgi:hypothetical protein